MRPTLYVRRPYLLASPLILYTYVLTDLQPFLHHVSVGSLNEVDALADVIINILRQIQSMLVNQVDLVICNV